MRHDVFNKLTLFGFLALVLVACSSDAAQTTVNDLPSGDAARGAALFTQAINGTPACETCHNTTTVKNVGPGLEGLGTRAADRVEGESAGDYLYNSITRPSRFLVSGFSNLMYNDYVNQLQPQQIADLIAYLLTL